MRRSKNKNKGFSLIELLIALAILSVLALMISRFMASTVASYRKNKESLKLQSDSSRVMTQLSDAICQANYIRIASADPAITYQLVPDNYANYVNPDKTTYRKVVVSPTDYRLVDSTKKDSYYPLSGDLDSAADVRSFRILAEDYKDKETKDGFIANYIYIEYVDKDASGANITKAVIFKWDKSTSELRMWRNDSVDVSAIDRFATAKANIDALSGTNGLITSLVKDFRILANVDEESLLTYIKFENGKYNYEMNEAIKFRNSEVLTVSPQKLFKTIEIK